MKRILFASFIIVCGFASKAQDVDIAAPDNKQMNDYDEIIIKKKDNAKDAKVTIEIKDDKVTVNGKPVEEYDGDEFTIRKHRPNTFTFGYPSSPFRMDGNSWSTDDNEGGPGGERAFLGVMSEKSADGVRIMEVTEASAADRAGLKKDDIITKINDKSITGPEQLSAFIATMQPKEKITVTYKRDSKENKADITLGGRKISRSRTIYSHGPKNNNMVQDFDLQGMNFNFDHKGFGDIFSGKPRLGIKAQDTEEGKGVKVVEVDEDSPAAKAGLKEDDIITSFEGKDVNSAEELAQASRESKDKSPLKVQVKRNGKSQNLEIKIPKKLKTADL